MANEGSIGPDDLLLYADDGSVYWVSEKTWKERKLPDNMCGQVNALLTQGVLVTKIPRNMPGVGAACFLMNLAGIKPPTFRAGAAPAPVKSEKPEEE